MTVRKAGFGASGGSHLSGRIEAEHALARPARGPLDLAVESDVYATSGRLRGAVRLGTWRGEAVESVAMVSARRSMWDVFRPASLDGALREWNAVDPVLAAALDGSAVPPEANFDAHQHGSDLSFFPTSTPRRACAQAPSARSARASTAATRPS